MDQLEKSKPICDWCGGVGQIIAKQYWSIVLIKCTKCHHEWQDCLSDINRIAEGKGEGAK